MPNRNENDLSAVLDKLACQRKLERTCFAPHATATSHRYEGIRIRCDPVPNEARTWTSSDTARALQDVPYDDILGLKFYHVDPLPFVLRYLEDQNNHSQTTKLFLDHEFPSHSGASISVNTCTRQGTLDDLLPGLLASSNCRDFANAGAKRAQRIQHYSKISRSCSWQREGAMSPLFSAFEADNIQQGAIGNCGFCSAFASLVQGWPELIQQAFGPYSEAALVQCGAYSLKLFPRGRVRYLLLDDHLLRYESKGIPPSLQSRQGDTWIEYMEKAIVKVQGSYASLDGHYKHNSLYRHPARTLQLLTGAPIAMEVHYNVESRKNSLQDVYEVLLASQGRYARVAHCRAQYQNLVPNHGYSLLWIGATTRGQRLVCLRNPHGRCSYRGKYGYGWNWNQKDGQDVTTELKKRNFFQRILLGCPITGADNGIFLIEFHVFARCFPIVTMVGPMGIKTGQDNPQTSEGEMSTAEYIYKSRPASLAHVKELAATKRC